MKTLTIETIKEKALPILKEAGITKSSLFGSYVRGEQNDKSDIDLLVEYPENTSLFDVAELKYKLEDELGRSVDLVEYNYIKPQLKQYILADQLQIL